MLNFLIGTNAPIRQVIHHNLPKLSQRVRSLSVEQWQVDMTNEINNLQHEIEAVAMSEIANRVGTIQSRLVYYELKGATTLLELELWMIQMNDMGGSDAEGRESCGVTCGADIVLPKVLEYLDSRNV